MEILKMGKKELLELKVLDVTDFLSAAELIHIAKTLGALWMYDYEAAARGKKGMHAILKSGYHSDAFFISRILLEPENIRRIISDQMAMRVSKFLKDFPDYVAGVPDGATRLGEDIAEIFGAQVAQMEKIDGRMSLKTVIEPGKSLLFVEDFCTRATGFIEAVQVADLAQPEVIILPYDPVILNRGLLKNIEIEKRGYFSVVSIVDWPVNDWPADNCPRCQDGSKPIKPKETDENWGLITTSQL